MTNLQYLFTLLYNKMYTHKGRACFVPFFLAHLWIEILLALKSVFYFISTFCLPIPGDLDMPDPNKLTLAFCFFIASLIRLALCHHFLPLLCYSCANVAGTGSLNFKQLLFWFLVAWLCVCGCDKPALSILLFDFKRQSLQRRS